MKFSVSHLRDASFAPRGLRSFFEYRDLGIKDATDGKVLAEYVHNDRHRELNSKLLFQPKPNALNLTRLVVITTRASGDDVPRSVKTKRRTLA